MHDVLRPEPTTDAAILPLTHAIETRVRRIQNDYRKNGTTLSDQEALDILDAVDLDQPPKRDEFAEIRQILKDGCYASRLFDRIVEVIKTHGSVECDEIACNVLTKTDRAKIEAATPGVSPWQWGSEWDADEWLDYETDPTFAGSGACEGLAVRAVAGFGRWDD